MTAAVLLLSVLLVAGCGGIEGKYSHEEKTPDGSGMKLTLELKSGDKAIMTMSGGPGDGSMSTEGTYKVEGDKVSVNIAGDTEVFTRSGNKLIGKGFGEAVELIKE